MMDSTATSGAIDAARTEKKFRPAQQRIRMRSTDSTADRAAFVVRTDATRDALLTDFGRATLVDRYLLPGETTQDLFARVSRAYADDADHAQRLYDYMSKLWFMPATPILSNGGTQRG